MNTHSLVLIRSDEGDGGWSLHTQEQIAEAKKHGDAPDSLNAGPAKWSESINGAWDRPNQQDYDVATLLAEIAERKAHISKLEAALREVTFLADGDVGVYDTWDQGELAKKHPILLEILSAD